MRDIRYTYVGALRFERDAGEWVELGFFVLLSPLWGPFYLLGRLAALVTRPFTEED